MTSRNVCWTPDYSHQPTPCNGTFQVWRVFTPSRPSETGGILRRLLLPFGHWWSSGGPPPCYFVIVICNCNSDNVISTVEFVFVNLLLYHCCRVFVLLHKLSLECVLLTVRLHPSTRGGSTCTCWDEYNKVCKLEVWCVCCQSTTPHIGGTADILPSPKLWPSAWEDTHEQLLSPPEMRCLSPG